MMKTNFPIIRKLLILAVEFETVSQIENFGNFKDDKKFDVSSGTDQGNEMISYSLINKKRGCKDKKKPHATHFDFINILR